MGLAAGKEGGSVGSGPVLEGGTVADDGAGGEQRDDRPEVSRDDVLGSVAHGAGVKAWPELSSGSGADHTAGGGGGLSVGEKDFGQSMIRVGGFLHGTEVYKGWYVNCIPLR